jgi:hypothetical protein
MSPFDATEQTPGEVVEYVTVPTPFFEIVTGYAAGDMVSEAAP